MLATIRFLAAQALSQSHGIVVEYAYGATEAIRPYKFLDIEETNDENVLIIHVAEVATLFVAEFGRVYEQARTAD